MYSPQSEDIQRYSGLNTVCLLLMWKQKSYILKEALLLLFKRSWQMWLFGDSSLASLWPECLFYKTKAYVLVTLKEIPLEVSHTSEIQLSWGNMKWHKHKYPNKWSCDTAIMISTLCQGSWFIQESEGGGGSVSYSPQYRSTGDIDHRLEHNHQYRSTGDIDHRLEHNHHQDKFFITLK